ncbi:hypothetical protein Tco_0423141, partial [Tanacetum coccineum]
MVFMAKMEKVLLDSEESLSSAEETIAEVSYYISDFEMDNDDVQEIFHDAIESASEKFYEKHIVSQTDHDESQVDNNNYEEKDHLVD